MQGVDMTGGKKVKKPSKEETNSEAVAIAVLDEDEKQTSKINKDTVTVTRLEKSETNKEVTSNVGAVIKGGSILLSQIPKEQQKEEKKEEEKEEDEKKEEEKDKEKVEEKEEEKDKEEEEEEDQESSFSLANLQEYIGKGKIMLASYQVILQMPSTISLSYPPGYTNMMNSLKILNLDFIKFVPIQCTQEFNFLSSLYVNTLLPIVGTAVLYLVYLLQTCYISYKKKYAPKKIGDSRYVGRQYFGCSTTIYKAIPLMTLHKTFNDYILNILVFHVQTLIAQQQ
jgi:hypothetical protein